MTLKMNGRKRFVTAVCELYHVLSAPRRCYVIQIFIESDEDSLRVRDLARKIAATEEDVPTDCATGEPYRNVYNALSQTHLPTLSDADVVSYDSDRQTVTAGPRLKTAALFIRLSQAAYYILHRDSITGSGDMRS